jgi:alpha-methylacyl-CoA racemase
VLEAFRPGVAEHLGIGPDDVPDTTVYCSITGFGDHERHRGRAGHDVNYLGWAGVLAGSVPPTMIADYTGAYAALRDVLAGLLERERSGCGARFTVSMTHESHRLKSTPLLRGGAACYRIYETADGRSLTVGALEPRFWQRLCELVGMPELASQQFAPRLLQLEDAFRSRSLADWLELFDREDVCVGPVATREEAAAEFAGATAGRAAELGEHTDAWRQELGL